MCRTAASGCARSSDEDEQQNVIGASLWQLLDIRNRLCQFQGVILPSVPKYGDSIVVRVRAKILSIPQCMNVEYWQVVFR